MVEKRVVILCILFSSDEYGLDLNLSEISLKQGLLRDVMWVNAIKPRDRERGPPALLETGSGRRVTI